MMAIAQPERPLPPSLLDAPGGFAWWYLDLVDTEGNGCVLIWSFGLPFLPGRESAARRGRPERAGDRPSLNVAIYRDGKVALYLLQEVPSSAATWGEGDAPLRIGSSTLHTRLSSGERCVDMVVDCVLPQGTRLRGEISLRGPGCRIDAEVGDDPRHQWSPLCTAARGRARFTIDGATLLDVSGRAYHDRNGSTAPLGALGIRHWIWGRAPASDGERIWYLLWPHEGAPEAWGLTVAPDGRVRVVPELGVRLRGARLGAFGMPWWRRVELTSEGAPWLTVEHASTVDLGFFYGRWIARATDPTGFVGTGFGEAVRPGRVDRVWNRWLVSMAVHRAHGPNSPFLPLFAGARGPRPRLEVAR
jgi:carotenoid 1,2-hydratase